MADDSTMSIAEVTGVQASRNPGDTKQEDTTIPTSPKTGEYFRFGLVCILVTLAGSMAGFVYRRKGIRVQKEVSIPF